MDEDAFDYFSLNPSSEVVPLSLKELEDSDPQLKACQDNRSRVEYFFTLSPCLPLYVFKKYPEIEHLAYVDSDLCFFDTPAPLYTELGEKSIYIIPHRFPDGQESLAEYGVFNVGFQIFRNNGVGTACLERWRNQCIEWCYDELSENRYADQKYLDEWPELYGEDLVISCNKGANLAPWNINRFSLSLVNGQLLVDRDPLIFYHFHKLRFVRKRLVVHGLGVYSVVPSRLLRDLVYTPYIGKLIRQNSALNRSADVTERLHQEYTWRDALNLLFGGAAFFYLCSRRSLSFPVTD